MPEVINIGRNAVASTKIALLHKFFCRAAGAIFPQWGCSPVPTIPGRRKDCTHPDHPSGAPGNWGLLKPACRCMLLGSEAMDRGHGNPARAGMQQRYRDFRCRSPLAPQSRRSVVCGEPSCLRPESADLRSSTSSTDPAIAATARLFTDKIDRTNRGIPQS